MGNDQKSQEQNIFSWSVGLSSMGSLPLGGILLFRTAVGPNRQANHKY